MSADPASDWQRWFIPGVFPMTVLEIASERGLASRDLLSRAGIPLSPQEIAESGLSLSQHLQLTQLVQQELADPSLSAELGWRLPPTALGSVGYAILASSTLREALEVLQRFWHLIGRASTLVVDTRGETGCIEIDVNLPVPDVQRSEVTQICFSAIYRGIAALAPQTEGEAEVWFSFPEPAHAAYLRRRLGNVRFGMPSSQFRFPTKLLDTRLGMSNSTALSSAIKWCAREEQERGLADGRLIARLQAELKPGPEGYPSLEDMARRLGMAPRTLRRHLQNEGTRYSALVETARRRESLRLLDNPRLQAHEVAEMLGYVDAANFTRAFRRWTGQTPSQYRSARKQRTNAKR
ncbi:MAG: AraC family transcriptional regulator [Myxococcales bacterium]|nr:AraC family transcriptional regulator [Myxococcales bacterium]